MGEADQPEEIGGQPQRNEDPDGQEGLDLEQSPLLYQIGIREELEGQRQLDKAQHHLDSVEPAARLWQRLHHAGEGGEQRKGKRQRQAEAAHAGGELHGAAVGSEGAGQQAAQNGARARKRYEGQRQRHEENAERAAYAFGLADFVGPALGQRQLVVAEERESEDDEDDEKGDVEPDVGRNVVEDVGVDAVHQVKRHAQQHIDQKDEEAVKRGIEHALASRPRFFGEEADRERDHREHAGGEQGHQAPDESQEKDGPQAFALHFGTGIFYRTGGHGIFQVGLGDGVEGARGRLRLVGGGAVAFDEGFCRLAEQGLARGRHQVERHGRGRQAARVVAGHVLEPTRHGLVGVGGADALHEAGIVLVLGHLHFEDGVEAGDALAARFRHLAHLLEPFLLVEPEAGGYGAVAFDVLRVDGPALVNGGLEDEVVGLVVHLFHACRPFDRFEQAFRRRFGFGGCFLGGLRLRKCRSGRRLGFAGGHLDGRGRFGGSRGFTLAVLEAFHFFFFCLCGCCGFGALQREAEIHFFGGQATRVVARHVFEPARDGLVIALHLHPLREGGLLAVFDHFHLEDGVEAGLAVRARLRGFALQHVVRALIKVERSGDGAVAFEVLRIDVPAVVDMGSEHQVELVALDVSGFESPFHGAQNLRLQRVPGGTNEGQYRQYVLHVTTALCGNSGWRLQK